jgi:predicted transcriptional regulator
MYESLFKRFTCVMVSTKSLEATIDKSLTLSDLQRRQQDRQRERKRLCKKLNQFLNELADISEEAEQIPGGNTIRNLMHDLKAEVTELSTYKLCIPEPESVEGKREVEGKRRPRSPS